jgi:methionyl aminopeptidase
MAVDIKSPREIEQMRVACQMAAETLLLVGEQIRAGMTTDDLNTLVHEDTVRRGAYPAPLNYRGFPKSVCTSINDVVCHGIPGPQVLKDGDIINVDVTTFYKGFYGDTSATFYIGRPSADALKVTEAARNAMMKGSKSSATARTSATSATPSRATRKASASAWSGTSSATESAENSMKIRR